MSILVYTRAATQPALNNQRTFVVWDQGEVVIPEEGDYIITGHMAWGPGSNTNALRSIHLEVDDEYIATQELSPGTGQARRVSLATIAHLTTESEVGLALYQNSGQTVTLGDTVYPISLRLVRIPD